MVRPAPPRLIGGAPKRALANVNNFKSSFVEFQSLVWTLERSEQCRSLHGGH